MRSSIAVAASVAAVASAQSLPIPSGVTDVAGVSSAVQQFSSAIAALPSDQQASISALVSSYTNGFTSFLSQTDSRGVVTGQPTPATSQPTPVTTQPTPVLTNPDVSASSVPTEVTVPAGVVGGSGSSSIVIGTGAAGPGSNGTVTTGRPTGTRTSSASDSSETSESSESGSSDSSGSATSSAASQSSTGAAAGLIEPAMGLGLAGAFFALFL